MTPLPLSGRGLPTSTREIEMAILNREQFLGAQDRKTKDIEVAALGGSVRLGAISANTLFKFRDLQQRRERGELVEGDIIGVVLAGSILDENNIELFTEDDIPRLMRKSPEVVFAIFKEAMELNNLAALAGSDVADPIEEARKNS